MSFLCHLWRFITDGYRLIINALRLLLCRMSLYLGIFGKVFPQDIIALYRRYLPVQRYDPIHICPYRNILVLKADLLPIHF